jgi:hypothetical protein
MCDDDDDDFADGKLLHVACQPWTQAIFRLKGTMHDSQLVGTAYGDSQLVGRQGIKGTTYGDAQLMSRQLRCL